MTGIGKLGAKGLFFCLLFLPLMFQRWALNSDIWFILKSGEYVMESGIPHTEPFSMHEGLHFVLEQWLTDIVFWNIFDSFGTEGLLFLTWLTGVALFYAYYKSCMLISENNKHISFLLSLFVGISVCFRFITTRPQIFSTLCLVLAILCMERFAKTKKAKWLIFLPLLSLLLINLHAALWPMLLIVMLPYLAAYLLGRMNPSVFPKDFPCIPIIIAGIGVFLAGFCNPYGWEAMSFVFYSYDPKIHEAISEIQPANLKEDYQLFIFLTVLIVAYARKKMPMQYFFLTFGTAIMALCVVRNEFLFFLLGTFPLAYAWKDWHSSMWSEVGEGEKDTYRKLFLLLLLGVLTGYGIVTFSEHIEDIPLLAKVYFTVLSLCFLCFFFSYRAGEKRFDFRIPVIRLKYYVGSFIILLFLGFTGWYPEQIKGPYGEVYRPALDFLSEQANPSDVVLWTGFNSGAYAEYRGFRSYVDARPEVFAPSNHHQEKNIIKEYFDTRSGELYYKEVFAQYGFTHILVTESDIAVYMMLPHDPDYHMIYEQKDEKGEVVCRIFVPNPNEDRIEGN